MAARPWLGQSTHRWLAIALCLAGASTAAAQRALVSLSGDGVTTTDLVDVPAGTARRLSTEFLPAALFTSAGDLVIYATPGGEWRARSMAGGPELVLPAFTPRFVHPRQTALFGGAGTGVARLDASGLRSTVVCPANEIVLSADIAPDSDALFVRCMSGAIAVLDANTLSLRRWLTLAPGGDVREIVATDGGREILAVEFDGGALYLRRFDVATGADRASVAWPAPLYTIGHLLAEPSRSHALVAVCPPGAPCVARRVNALTLGLSAPLDADAFAVANGHYAIDPAEQVLHTWGPSGIGRTDQRSGAFIDALSFAVRPQRYLVAVTWPPLPPVAPSAAVAQSTVTLRWSRPAASPQVAGYRLEAGVAPGTTAVSIDLGPDRTATIPGVPAGRYYARLRAVNATGVSPPSAEVVVDVP